MRLLQRLVGNSGSVLYRVLSGHCHAIKLGSILDVYLANNLLTGYTKCGQLCIAWKLFNEMLCRDIVSWNTMIAGDVNAGKFESAWQVLRAMRRCGFDTDGYTFGSLLKGVAYALRLDLGEQLHSMIFKLGYAENVYCSSALLDMYAKCERVEDAFVVFQHIPEPNSVSWNALISGFTNEHDRQMAFWLLDLMEKEGRKPDDGTFAPILTLLDDPEFYKLTAQVHGKIIKHGLDSENTVGNATITSYSLCGSIDDAKKVFERSCLTQDIVTWNSMLAAYLVHGKEELAIRLFKSMQCHGFERDIYTYTSMITACSDEAWKNQGKSLHGVIIKRGLEQSVAISNTLIGMYPKFNNKSMEEALHIFNSMECKDRVSWNSILTGFYQTGLSEDALNCFAEMRSLQVEIDQYAFSAAVSSCSYLATLQLGQQIHALALKIGLESNNFVASSLMFMYSKCGIIEDARKCFEETPQVTSVTWNSIIFGYAQHGLGHEALHFFQMMRDRKVKPDHITFVAVLTACSHIGLVEEGRKFLNSMEPEYGIPPRMEHYACAIDLFGRAGRVNDAKALIESMPYEPNTMVWKTVLGACRTSCDIEYACEVASKLLETEPEEHCTYVLLSEIYGHVGMWGEKANIKRLMRERRVKKVPGQSWVEVNNEVHAFSAEDCSHPHCKEIYMVLVGLSQEIQMLDGYRKVLGPDTEEWMDYLI